MDVLVRKLFQILVYTTACQGHHPVSADVIQTFGKVTQFHHDNVCFQWIDAQILEVLRVMETCTLFGHDDVHGSHADNYRLVVHILFIDTYHGAFQLERRSITVVYLCTGFTFHGGTDTGLYGFLNQFRSRKGGIYQLLSTRILEFLVLAQFMDGPGHVTGTAGCRVVAHVADEVGLLVAFQGCLYTDVQIGSRSNKLKLMSYIPKTLSQEASRFFDGFLVIARHHDASVVARFIRPCVCNPDGCIDDTFLNRYLRNLGIKRFARFHTGTGFLAREKNRYIHPCLVGRLSQSLFQTFHQVGNRSTLRNHAVFVGSHAEAGNEVGILGQTMRHVSVKVHGSGDDGFIAHHVTYSLDEVAFRVFQSLHTHGAMNIEIQPVVRQIFFQHIERFLGDGFVSFTGNDTTWGGRRHTGWKPFSLCQESGILRKEWITFKQIFSFFYTESCLVTGGRGESTTLDGDTGNTDTWQFLFLLARCEAEQQTSKENNILVGSFHGSSNKMINVRNYEFVCKNNKLFETNQ